MMIATIVNSVNSYRVQTFWQRILSVVLRIAQRSSSSSSHPDIHSVAPAFSRTRLYASKL